MRRNSAGERLGVERLNSGDSAMMLRLEMVDAGAVSYFASDVPAGGVAKGVWTDDA